MITKIKIFGQIKSGVLNLWNRKYVDNQVKQFPDCDVEIVIKKRGKRSIQQNAYYFGVVLDCMQRELLRRGNRYEIEDLHEWCKQKFNCSKLVVEETGELIEIGQTTTELNKEEFGQFLDRIIEWCAKSLEITIPAPGEQASIFNDQAA